MGRGKRRCGRCWGAFLHVRREEEDEDDEGSIPGSRGPELSPGRERAAGAAERDLLRSAQKVAPSLFSFLSGFKAASKFLRSQILPGTARKPGQQQVRAVSVPTTQPGLLRCCG